MSEDAIQNYAADAEVTSAGKKRKKVEEAPAPEPVAMADNSFDARTALELEVGAAALKANQDALAKVEQSE